MWPSIGWRLLTITISYVFISSATTATMLDDAFSELQIAQQDKKETSTQPVIDLITRVSSPGVAKLFDLSLNSSVSCQRDHMECFQVSASNVSGHVQIIASSLLSLSYGVGFYLKTYCNASLTWVKTGGLHVNLPAHPTSLPSVDSPQQFQKSVDWTYYQNVVESSYSAVWWDWKRWEIEIDWMAFHGVNLLLSYTGQEAVYRQLYKKHGLDDTQLGKFFNGPAYLSWSRGQFGAGIGGPLPLWWYDQQAQLNKQILARVREFGMTPILPGFQGNVPVALKKIYPTANISSSGWLPALDPLFTTLADDYMKMLIAEFGTDHYYQADGFFNGGGGPWAKETSSRHGKDSRIDITDVAFGNESVDIVSNNCTFTKELLNSYIPGCSLGCKGFKSLADAETACASEWTCTGVTVNAATGVSALFKVQSYQLRSGSGTSHSPTKESSWLITNPSCHHMPPIIPDHQAFLVSQAAYQGLARTDPEAVWVYQTWIWRGFGMDKLPFLKGWISAVPEGKYILLDQTAERVPLWSKFGEYSFFNTTFIWCAMHEMGGNIGLFGDLNVINNAPMDALRSPSLAGIGIDPEGINQNPAYYEFVLEAAWRDQPIDLTTWIRRWAGQRCGGYSAAAEKAWELLFSTVYSGKWQHYEHHIKLCPIAMPYGSHWDQPMVKVPYNISILHQAWGLLIQASAECVPGGQEASNPGFIFDLIDVGREFLSVAPCVAAYDQLTGAKSASSLHTANATMVSLLTDLDALLGTSRGFLLGQWLHDARSLATESKGDPDFLEWNARAQVTSWEPVSSSISSKLQGLWDYGNKEWNGLVGSYYSKRYQIFASRKLDAITTGKGFDKNRYYYDLNKFTYNFQNQTWSEKLFPSQPTGDPIALSKTLHQKYPSL